MIHLGVATGMSFAVSTQHMGRFEWKDEGMRPILATLASFFMLMAAAACTESKDTPMNQLESAKSSTPSPASVTAAQDANFPAAAAFPCTANQTGLQQIFKTFQVVLIGEIHTISPAVAGANQGTTLLNEICGAKRQVVILLEAFYRRDQQHIDDFLSGKISFDTFDLKTGFSSIYKKADRIENYGGILKMAKAFGWRVRALELNSLTPDGDDPSAVAKSRAISKTIPFFINGRDAKSDLGIQIAIDDDWFRPQSFADDIIDAYEKTHDGELIVFFGGGNHPSEIAGLMSDRIRPQNVGILHLGMAGTNFTDSPVPYRTFLDSPPKKFRLGHDLSFSILQDGEDEDVSFLFGQAWRTSQLKK